LKEASRANPDRVEHQPTGRQPVPARADWVLILGATSPLAHAAAGELAIRGYRLLLAGRDQEELWRCAADLRIRHGREVATVAFDALDLGAHASFVEEVEQTTAGQLGGVVSAVGTLGDQARAASDARYAAELFRVNFVGVASALTGLAPLLEKRGGGFIIGITSVAGDRGRQSNFVYGSAKGGLALWLQGLRNRLHSHGVRVITVKPGFVDTEMTFGLPGLFLVAGPGAAGKAIVRALDRRRDVVYVPAFWRYIMCIIRAVPEVIFKRMQL